MLGFTDKVVAKKEIKTELTLTENEVFQLMDSALGGGIGHWAGLDNNAEEWIDKPKGEALSVWAAKILIDGKEVKLYDIEEPEEDAMPLTMENLIEGYAQNYKERPFDKDIMEGDVITADCIIQYALFGKLVYS